MPLGQRARSLGRDKTWVLGFWLRALGFVVLGFREGCKRECRIVALRALGFWE